jgi:hypothetical protein
MHIQVVKKEGISLIALFGSIPQLIVITSREKTREITEAVEFSKSLDKYYYIAIPAEVNQRRPGNVWR